jgi:hypothetical protein
MSPIGWRALGFYRHDTTMADLDAGVIDTLVETVRRASRLGELVPLDEVWPEGEAEFKVAAAARAAAGAADTADIALIRECGKAYLFSDLHMTRRYAEAAALGASRNPLRIIAATVRSDSAIYPRPTPMETFYDRPFCLSRAEVAAAVDRMRADAQYPDIKTVRASNGAEFLFSSDHLGHDQAGSMAEWLAVEQYDNP